MLGKDLLLFTTSDYARGAVMWLHRGTKLIALLKEHLLSNLSEDYLVVSTPPLYRKTLMMKSGHLSNYNNNMFLIDNWCFKPMSCPAHILIYKDMYKGQNIKMFEFGSVFRREATGALRTLTRCFNFTQDDAHIFTDKELYESEIHKLLDEIERIYSFFHIKYRFTISRNDKFNEAANVLEKILKERGINFNIDPEGAAFYGPKIDIQIDHEGRSYQMGTIQLDFITLNNFNISNKVLIHRALIGSIERFIGIYLEIYKGYFPFLIDQSPIFVINGANSSMIKEHLHDKQVFYNLDKIKHFKTLKVPKIYIYGPQEQKSGTMVVETYCPIQSEYVHKTESV